MRLRSIAFKWSVDLPLDGILPALAQVGLNPNKQFVWTRSIGEHQLQVEYRPRVSEKERSFFWLHWESAAGVVDPGGLDRILAEWFFTMSQYATTTVNWLQVPVDQFAFQPLHGYKESSPKIWSKEEKGHHFSFYPMTDTYFFVVRNRDARKAIQHQRFSFWIDELKHNLLGHSRPDDQITFDLVG
ncbi:hypothetical protein [Cohnella soli]|uniref:Uncharacterized protein n=1 Tax=Cohnella soli TaxID=425005 RepID=A0ABW0HMI9_9BACL